MTDILLRLVTCRKGGKRPMAKLRSNTSERLTSGIMQRSNLFLMLAKLWRQQMLASSRFRKYLRPEHKFKFSVALPIHPDQKGTRDPRRVWCYDCGIRDSSVEEHPWNGERTYYFSEEADFLMFKLRWENEQNQ